MLKRSTAALLIFLVSLFGSVSGQSESSSDSLDELALSRALFDDQQDRFGSLDSRLIEPLEQLADALMQLNQFDEAHTMLDRALQIVRIEDGLYTENSTPPSLKRKSQTLPIEEIGTALEKIWSICSGSILIRAYKSIRY